ncbi:MAG: sigma-70 family RNA polymerase sigma factor [Saprospiraceae bacterium]|nr:sigma-70 family RNA polymerase sigma factor [Saprospiraceae bacterium]
MDIPAVDEGMVRLLREGDRKAVNTFVDRYGQFMYHVCYKVLLNTDEAEEATQDAVMKVIQAIENFKLKSSFKAWCYTIAFRTAIDYKRKVRKHVDLEGEYELANEDMADDNIHYDETKQGIQLLMRHLDDESRMVISLFYLEEKNIREVIALTGLTESNVKIKLFRARKEMTKHADKYFEKV